MASGDLPPTETVAGALLHLLWLRVKPMQPKDLYGPLAELMNPPLTPEQVRLKRRTTHESKWHNRVQTARKLLLNKKWLDGSRRGFWSLTEEGQATARSRDSVRGLTIEELGL